MVQFAVTGLVAMVAVAVAAGIVFRTAGADESVRDARAATRALADAAVEPNLTRALLAGDRGGIARFDRFVRARVLGEGVVRVKLWTPGGRVVYSDEHRLIGSRYPLASDDLKALRTGRVDAEESDLSQPENRFERRYGELLEVYKPVKAPGGGRLLFEAYMLESAVAESARRIWRDFAPALGAALVLLWLVQIPLARSLARRLRRSQEERERLLLRALEASNTERRRIAGDLHDGVVQDLAGTSLALAGVADRSDSASRSELSAALRDGAQQTRQSIRRLRSLLVEIYPPNLHSAGLDSALEDLLAPLLARGVDARLESCSPVSLSRDTEQAIFRTAQEALRNVAEHADARHARVLLEAPNGHVRLTVEDDGIGFCAERAEARRATGHLGLSLLADGASDLGGSLDVDSAPGRGTRVVLELPWS